MSVADCDKQLFHAACEKVMRQQCPQKGIGTLSEKTVHAVLKNFYETDPAHQEIPVENYVADILRDGEIIEIQTRSLTGLFPVPLSGHDRSSYYTYQMDLLDQRADRRNNKTP